MERSEFERAIKLGLGRVIIYLQNHDAKPYRDIILNSCLHNLTYDTQVEGYKIEYIVEIIELTSDMGFYREHIMKAAYAIKLEDNDFTKDEYHICHLVHELALRGDIGARQFIYDAYQTTLSHSMLIFAYHIIELDNLDGFLHVIEHSQYDDYDWQSLLWTLGDEVGKTEAQQQLNSHRLKNPKLDDVLNIVSALQTQKNQRHQHVRNNPPHMSYTNLKSIIQSKRRDILTLRNWARYASQQDVIDVANDLILETDEEKLIRYLMIFRDTPFPLEPETLFHLFDYEHPQIRGGVTRVLSTIKHPAIRNLALTFIADNKLEDYAIKMLTTNAETGDWSLLEDVVQRDFSIDEFHWVQFAVSRRFFRENPDKAALDTLLHLYEYAPCSDCRYYIVKNLQAINGLSEAIKRECFFDSNPDIRELAQQEF